MLSVINKKQEFSNLLQSLGNVVEVYSTLDFSMFDTEAMIVFLIKRSINSTRALFTLNKLFTDGVRFYIVRDQYSAILSGKRIVWKEGVWYV